MSNFGNLSNGHSGKEERSSGKRVKLCGLIDAGYSVLLSIQ